MAYTTPDLVYQRTGLTATEVDLSVNTSIIEDAEAELEMLTGRKFTNSNVMTEFISGGKKDILGITGTKPTTLMLSNYPIQTIISFERLNISGTTAKIYEPLGLNEYETEDYWIITQEDPLTNTLYKTNKIKFKTEEVQEGTNNYKIVYTYGYTTVPIPVRNLATCLAGIRAWLRFLGGCYNRLNSYSIPEQSVNKGDFYQRGKQMIDELTAEANRLLDRIGRKPRTLFYATGQTR